MHRANSIDYLNFLLADDLLIHLSFCCLGIVFLSVNHSSLTCLRTSWIWAVVYLHVEVSILVFRLSTADFIWTLVRYFSQECSRTCFHYCWFPFSGTRYFYYNNISARTSDRFSSSPSKCEWSIEDWLDAGKPTLFLTRCICIALLHVILYWNIFLIFPFSLSRRKEHWEI